MSTTVAIAPAGLLSRFLSKCTGPLSSRITDNGGSFDDNLTVFKVAGPVAGGSESDKGAESPEGPSVMGCRGCSGGAESASVATG